MEIFCTYCAKPKDDSDQDLPAIKRYKSQRIKKISESAKVLNLPFYILSGEFGLISENMSIPYYDHLLMPNEVVNLAKKVSDQITKSNISKIVFFMNSYHNDRNIFTYLSVLYLACNMTNVPLTTVLINFEN